MKVKVTDPGSNSAKRKRLVNAISELVYDVCNAEKEYFPDKDEVLYINPDTFDLGICKILNVPKGSHYHPIAEVAMRYGEEISVIPEYVEKIAKHYFPD